MLRFDIAPVCSNAYRIQAAVSLSIAVIYLFTPYKWVSLILVFSGFVRGFVSPHKCLSYKLFEKTTASLNRSKKVNAGSKMFADKIAAIAGSIMAVSWLAGSGIGYIPAGAILVFASLDLVTGFCAACWAYAAWYRIKAAKNGV